MTEQATVLIVEDDETHRVMLRTVIGGWGYDCREAADGADAIALVAEGPFDLILMDIRMLKVSGLEALVEIRRLNPAIPVVIMTAFASVDTAVAALKKGAYDYLTKPLDFEKLRVTLLRAMEHRQLRAENQDLRRRLDARFDARNIVGRSPAMAALLETVAQVAPSEATVLITGESGSGKEMIAEAIHHNSPRREGPYITLNCAAVTETLLESELFGHEKGAFTGAGRRKEGRFVQAHGGTLLLDEVGEMPLSMQVKLLRVLQERELTRVGGEAVVAVDVRLVAATNQDLEEMVAAGRFRQDLYYRLNVVGLQIPPLRERREDIPLLAQHFLEVLSRQNRKAVTGFTPAAMDRLIRMDWPGNVRELRNAVERAVVLARASVIDLEDPGFPAPDPTPSPTPPPEPHAVGATLDAVEQQAILKTLADAGGNKSETARRLGITRRTLHKKLKKYGVMP
jgi:two-component system response regulator HydG